MDTPADRTDADAPGLGRLTDVRDEGTLFAMSSVQEIKAAIDALSPREQYELHALLHPQEDDAWDEQMRADTEPGGKLQKLMLEAEADAQAGRLRDWPAPGQA